MVKLMLELDRYGRWILAVLMLLFIITGIGITKGIMEQRLAKQLHENILPLPFYFLVLVHVFTPIRNQLLKQGLLKSEKAATLYSSVIFTILLVLFFWLHFR